MKKIVEFKEEKKGIRVYYNDNTTGLIGYNIEILQNILNFYHQENQELLNQESELRSKFSNIYKKYKRGGRALSIFCLLLLLLICLPLGFTSFIDNGLKIGIGIFSVCGILGGSNIASFNGAVKDHYTKCDLNIIDFIKENISLLDSIIKKIEKEKADEKLMLQTEREVTSAKRERISSRGPICQSDIDNVRKRRI